MTYLTTFENETILRESTFNLLCAARQIVWPAATSWFGKKFTSLKCSVLELVGDTASVCVQLSLLILSHFEKNYSPVFFPDYLEVPVITKYIEKEKNQLLYH